MRNSFIVNPTLPSNNSSPKVRMHRKSQIRSPSEQSNHKPNQALEQEKLKASSYQQKNQRNIIKCKLLYDKLTALGNVEGVQEMISNEVSEVDLKIKELELQLHFKRSQQIKKLRKRVSKFLQQINFEVPPQDMQKIQDEVQIILFLLDVFEQKFNQMTTQRKEINQLIARLEESSNIIPQKNQHLQTENDEITRQNERILRENTQIRKENQELMEKIEALERQIYQVKNQDLKNLQAYILENQSQLNHHHSSSFLDSKIAGKMNQLKIANRRIVQLEHEVKIISEKYRILEVNLERSKKQQARWKERYKTMELQKDQRIMTLESSLPRP